MRGDLTAALLLLLVTACGSAPRITLLLQQDLSNQCQPLDSPNGAPPRSCEDLTLGCADRLQFRVYAATPEGKPADILRSVCVSTAELGNPRNFCELVSMGKPYALLKEVPEGAPVILWMRALRLRDIAGGCDNEVTLPEPVFTARSEMLAIDGKSHDISIRLTACHSLCPYLSPADGGNPGFDMGASRDLAVVSDGGWTSDLALGDLGPGDLGPADLASPGDLATPICPAGLLPSPYYPPGARCCPALSAEECPPPGSSCPGGGVALLPSGGCCGECPF